MTRSSNHFIFVSLAREEILSNFNYAWILFIETLSLVAAIDEFVIVL